MGKINWSKLAYKDLDSIHDYIAQDSEMYAKRFIEKIFDRVTKLDEFPDLGRVVPEFSNETVREIIEGNYRIVYKVKRDSITIARVHHAARLLKKTSKK